MRGVIRDAGFRDRAWVDVTVASLAWIDQRLTTTERSPLGPHVEAVFG